MESDSTKEPEPQTPKKAARKRNFFLVSGVLILVIAGVALSGYSLWSVHKLSSKIDDISFSQTSSNYSHDNDLLSSDIGIIQFMHRGYTITFNSITYGQNGLQVTGTIGNPTELSLSSLTLKLSARPYLYKVRDKIEKDPFFLWGNAMEIGSGETSIGYLGAGKTEVFSMTIPNVKQTPDGFEIAASFSGERYSY